MDRTTGYNALKVNENSKSNKSNGSYLEKYNILEKEFVDRLETPERIMVKIESLKKEKDILEDNIKSLKKLLDSKLTQVEI
jgi:6-phosphogluconate dehydrogenase